MTGTQTARGLAVALAVTIGVLLLADLAVVAARVGPSGSEVDDDPRPLEAVLPELITFVEQARGLRFRTPPDVRLLADDEFDAQLTEGDPTDADEQAADDAAYLGLLRALGLIEGGVDLDQLAADTVASIVGFYDTDSKVLYARGASATPYVKEVLVHELTHALDDQHFGIEGADLVDDVAAAFDALVEGSATAVEDRWFDARPAAEQDEITREDGVGTVRGDDVFTALFGFPYVAGPAFVESLLDAGGTARLDDAFRRPPRSTEQILHPDRYLAGDAPVPVDAPPAGGRVVEEGTLGELFLFLVLDAAANRESARRAAEGWAGDTYVVWAQGRRTCVRWAVATDTPADAAELRSTLRAWLGDNRAASVSATDPAVITNCA